MKEVRGPVQFFVKCWTLNVGRWTFFLSAACALLSALLVLPSLVGAPSPFPAPSSAKSLFQDRPFGPLPPPTPTPSPKHIALEDEEPIPASWWIGGIAAAVLALAGILYGAARRAFLKSFRSAISLPRARRRRAAFWRHEIRRAHGHRPFRRRGAPLKSERRLGTPLRLRALPGCCVRGDRAFPPPGGCA